MSSNFNKEATTSGHIYLHRVASILFIVFVAGEHYVLIVATICCGIRSINKYLYLIYYVVDDCRTFHLVCAWGVAVEACNVSCLVIGVCVGYDILANLTT